ncbi:hypothetical protein [Reinekea marinisedimentorum]|uniref:Uncharacterized protein n=1 Tax=Reinekea marinisedimentorum TaxID=230495 RepID=A0A4R3I8M6_9GAMM|nr:hypothetical protein [Reinekea marinisedimentorum]TCS41649.1 hypothetical protein BCF53_10576 [Reinekea marinisedimentorum]
MTLWRKQTQNETTQSRLHIEFGELTYYRSNGAITRLEIDDLRLAELRVINGEVYWYLEDQSGAFALIPETMTSIGLLRRYLSNWRGFNYDGLLRFDTEQQTRLQLWPLLQDRVA